MRNLVGLIVLAVVGWLLWSWFGGAQALPQPDNGRALMPPSRGLPGYYAAGDAAWGGSPL